MNNFWSNGKKCQNAKMNLMPGNMGKSIRRQTRSDTTRDKDGEMVNREGI